MKKTIKIFALISGIICVIIFLSFVIYFLTTYKYNIDVEKIKKNNVVIEYYDNENQLISEETNGKEYVSISKLPSYTYNAFVAIEDKRFYTHNGIDIKGLSRAFMSNIKNSSISQGGSTITQQLVKNTYLTQEKTLKRKLIEIHLSKQLENSMTKKQILESYLNNIYFGNNCYGITKASKFYFNKNPENLTVNESAILASIINSPSYYNPITHKENCSKRKNLVLKQMREQGYITNEEYQNAKNVEIEIKTNQSTNGYLSLVKQQLNDLIDKNPYFNKIKVYTYLDKNMQTILNGIAKSNYNEKEIIMNNNGEILAYKSNCANNNRQLGSVIKPLLVYAPAIEENSVHSCSIINDERISFNGYTPHNYNDKYYGKISVKDSLAKSSNVSAVKILQSVGIDKAKEYLSKTDLKLSENDNSLCIALGCTEKGALFTDLSSAYTVFLNDGYYKNAKIIKEIKNESNQTVYKVQNKNVKVFDKDTTYIVNDMLKNVVQNGTARKLKNNFEIYAKTGTVGYKEGNTDAYTVSFDKDYIVGCWVGNKSSVYLPNEITGGTMPCVTANSIWERLYSNKKQDKMYKEVYAQELEIDKAEYSNEKIVLADDLCPKENKIKQLFKYNFKITEKSNSYSHPEIKELKTSINQNVFTLSLCLSKYIKAEIYLIKDGKEEYLQDTNLTITELNCKISPETECYFKVIPYFESNNEKHYGNPYFSDKIKTPKSFDLGDNWWTIE